MHTNGSDSGLRHLDFAFFDTVIMQISLLIMYHITNHHGFMYVDRDYSLVAVSLFVAQMALGVFSDAYVRIFTRDAWAEFRALLLTIGELWLLVGVFILLTGVQAGAWEMIVASVLFFDLDFFVRIWNKRRHLRKGLPKRRVVVITTSGKVDAVLLRLRENQTAADHELTGVLLLDQADPASFQRLGVPVLYVYDENTLETVTHWWVDDAFVLQEEGVAYPKRLIENFLIMGISVHTCLSVLDEFSYSSVEVDELGSFKVLTNSVKFVSDRAMFMKRALDIAGGLLGTLATGLLCLIIGPMIYIKSPGPIFFTQKRIGMNGRVFNMYKFRSMYMDAEKRKAELMAKNKIQSGLMFKLDDDPRIIGSEKKGKDGKPRGIGNFIRNTSLDEFPQFINVLKGDMSLVGTRPPTLDEWNHYDPHHRIRMSAKPGITGMWQVSGRSKITDFEQVVALDQQYIENWNFWLDIKILFKTVVAVVKHEGAV